MKIWALTLLVVAVYAKHEIYEGYKTYYVTPKSQDELKTLGSVDIEYELDFLSRAYIERPGVVLVKPDYQDRFTNFLNKHEIEYKIHSADVKSALEFEDVLFEQRRQQARSRNGGRDLPYDSYHQWTVIDQYLQDVAREHPETVTLVTAGNSFEGRPIRYLKISTTNFEDTSKPVIFIDGGIHAREWISPPTVTYAIHKLVENVTDPDLLQNFDWILLPVVNPDGYQFTFTNNRFWRKTRSTDTHSLSGVCPGVDGNRNYDFFWNTVGTSDSPCSDVYAGNRPFSEVEARVVRDIINEYLARISLYLTMHSFGSMILYPWGHDGSLSGNAFALHTVGVAMAQAIDAASHPSFPRYIVGNSVLVVGYPIAGSSEDYAHYAGVPLSYTYELPGLGNGVSGFDLDPIWIDQVVRETWEGIKVGARRARDITRN